MLSSRGKGFLFLIFFVSFSAFSFELTLTRIFSILMWYHFASLAIGLSMLGLGAGGVFSYLLKDRINEVLIKKIFIFYLTTFLLVHLAFFYIHHNPYELVPFLSYFHQPYFQPFQRGLFYSISFPMVIVIIFAYVLLVLPFFLAGVIISGIFKLNYKESQRLYYADMAGAALGSVFVALILNFISPMNLLSLIVILGGVFVFLSQRLKWYHIFLIITAFVTFAAGFIYKKDEIPIARGKVAKEIIWVDWNAFSRVILYPLKGEEGANPFGQSPYYTGKVPEQWGLLVDDTGYTTVSEAADREDLKDFFRWNIISLPYVIRKSSTLIIGPGGGKDINCALAMGVAEKNITAVELNPLVVKAVDNILGEKTGGLYKKVNSYVKEGRSFLEKDKKSYDVLQATSVYGRIPPAAGIFTFSEDSLYTAEAFKTYLSRLNEGGILALSRFIYEQTVPKMILLSLNVLKQLGVNKPEDSLFLAKERGLAILLVKKGIFTKEEVGKLTDFCNQKGFEILYEPFTQYDNSYSNLITSRDRWDDYDVPTDDKPFYYYSLSKKAFISSMIFKNDSFEEKGIAVLKFFFYLSLIFVFLIIIMPLLIRDKRGSRSLNISLGIYFFSLGIGYIMIEIIFIKSFSIFLETPVYSMIFVTGSMLLSSALGAYFSRNWLDHKSLKKVFVLIFLLTIGMTFVQRLITDYLFLPILLKILLTIFILSPTGFLLGMPFPFILKRVGKNNDNLVTWGIALNSASSVFGSFFCLMLVINIGFRNSLYAANFFYLMAFFMLFLIERKYEKD